ncbi:MAG: DNA-directed RNA polymerase subunit omega [Bacteroidales bacterium]|jgi:DNA-directed RNA polymerase subunit K/omega|nr:DNA-directed RNA polymerase subunit omega [Bacteroidales bacterium]
MPVDFKKSQAPLNTVTRDTVKLSEKTGNVYEMVNIIAKRANQISLDLKDELSKKLQEFASYTDNLEEVFENREQIEISRYYERLPKPVSIAAEEYAEDKLYFRREDSEAGSTSKAEEE